MTKIYKRRFKEDRRNILLKTFDQWLKKEFKGNIQGFACETGEMYIEERYPWIKDEYEDMEFETEEEREEAIEKACYDEFHTEQSNMYDNWIYKYKRMKFPMTVYRVIGLKAKNIDDIVNIELSKQWKKGVGIYWTDGEGQLESYWTEGGKDFTIRALVQEKDINWKGMLYNNMHPSIGESEAEIQVEEGTKIRLNGIAEGATVRDREFEELDILVKA